MKTIKSLFVLLLCSVFTSCGIISMGGQNSSKTENPDNYRVILTLKSDEKVEGYIQSGLRDFVQEVQVSPTLDGKGKKTYSSEEVIRLVYPATPQDPTELIYITAKRKEKPTEKPVFMKLVYDGKNAQALEVPINSFTRTPTTGMQGKFSTGTRFYYLIKKEGIANYYWYAEPGANSIVGGKRGLKKLFKDYPSVLKGLDDKSINMKKDPAEVVRLLDKDLGSK